MTTPPKPPVDLLPSTEDVEPLTREAFAWIAYLHSGEEKPDDWEKFEAWKAASEAHRKAADEAGKLWEQLGPSLRRYSKSRDPKIPLIVAGAIGLAAAAFAGGLLGPPKSYFADYRSATGEVRTVTLKDGSQVDMDTATSFDMSGDGRTMTLYTGQVYVTVKRDPTRPFRVMAGRSSVEALGTAFAVKVSPEQTRVVVTEHAVRVRTGGDRVQTADVNAGEAVSFTQDSLGVPQPADAATLTAWRAGELHFKGRALGEVAAEIARYRRGAIYIADADLKQLPVTGNSDLHDTDAFLEAIELSLPIRPLKLPGLTIIMRDRERPLPGR